MKLRALIRQLWSTGDTEQDPEPALDNDEDPYTEPVELQISDVIDLHAIPPYQVKAVVNEYLYEAHRRGYRYVRIIHGKGIGVQREMVRGILERTSFVTCYADAPPEAGGLGATLATLETDRS